MEDARGNAGEEDPDIIECSPTRARPRGRGVTWSNTRPPRDQSQRREQSVPRETGPGPTRGRSYNQNYPQHQTYTHYRPRRGRGGRGYYRGRGRGNRDNLQWVEAENRNNYY